MNKLFRKTLASSLVLAMLFSHNVYANPIYTYKETTNITNSVNLTKAREFYSDHNITYTVIEADLTDDNLSFNLLKSENGIDTFDTVSNLAKTDKNTVAAVNGDFFSSYKNGRGFSLGLEIKDGNLLQSPINPDTMATIFYNDNLLNMEYIDFNISVIAPNGESDNIRHLNKHTDYYGDILMFTSAFNGGNSPAVGGEVVEIVVEKGKITEFRRNMPSVKIPKSGYVLAVSEGVNMFFANNFEVGDEIKLNYSVSENLFESNVAFGGGSIIVSKGKALESFTHTVSGYNPRTAIGTDKSGKKLYLVTVDGRTSSSRGMTMTELAHLMESLGCYTAVNLDGGGSSNMVASTVFNNELTTVNSPTENRKVINAVSISHNADIGKTTGVKIKADKEVIFIGESVNLTASAHDKYMRPTNDNVILTSSEGDFDGATFAPTKGGIATIKARCDKTNATLKLFVIDKISGIKINNHIALKKGESKILDIEVFDKNGNYARIENTTPFEITSSDESVVSIDGKTLTGHKDGTAIITVKKDDAVSYASITVGSEKFIYTEDFENPIGEFNAYPESAKGSFEKSDEHALSGAFSGKLSFDFTNEDNETKAVYYTLIKPQLIYEMEDEISLSVYAENDFNHTLKAQLTDASGEIFKVDFGKNLEKETWHNLSASVPKDAKKPVTLDRIYAVYTNGEEKDEGAIYFDDLIFTSANEYDFLPSSPNTYTDIEKYNITSSTVKIGTFLNDEKTLFTSAINRKTEEKVSDVKLHYILDNTKKFGTNEDDFALYINVDAQNDGIRKTDGSQWDKIFEEIKNTKKENVFILSYGSIFGSDEFENKVIKDFFASLSKNVFVICGGDKNTYANFDGVKYFTLKNTEKTFLSPQTLENYTYLQFSFDDEVTYKWKSLFE